MQSSALQLSRSAFRGTQIRVAPSRSPVHARQSLHIVALKDLAGTVVSVHMHKTAVIEVDRYVPHRIYGKRVRRTKKHFAHDEDEICDVGDTVRIISIPPVSKRKCYQVDKILAKGAI